MTNPTHAPADILDAKALEDVARAIYGVMPNYGVEWRPNTNGGSSQVRVDDPWEDAPDRHADCLAQAEAAINAYRASLPAGNEPVAWTVYDWSWTDETGEHHYARTPERMERLKAAGHKLTPVYTLQEQLASPLTPAEGPIAWQSDKLGAWLSAALDDPMVADEYKQAINDWFAAGQPIAPLDWRAFLRLIDKHQYAFERVPAAWNAFVKLRNEVCALTPAEGEAAQPVQVGQKWRWLGRMETEFFTPGQCYTILSIHPGTDYTSVYITDNNGAGSNGGQGHSWSFGPEAGSDNFLDHFELAASRSTPSGEKGNG